VPLRDVPIRLTSGDPPARVQDFLREAQRRIAAFQETRTIASFVPSNFELLFRCLQPLYASPFLRGNRFCELGSGFGVVACLATMIGFKASGIEIEPALVEESGRLAADYSLPVDFFHGSFVPAAETTRAGPDANPRRQAPIDEGWFECDIAFVYPWPDEERQITLFFEQRARPGALLLTYQDGNILRLRKKVGKR